MRASIIVSVYTLERIRDLSDAVGSILSQMTAADELLILADGRPELVAGLQKAFAGKALRIIEAKEPGLCYARNLGIRESRGEFIVFVDDDAVPQAGWLAKLLKPYSDPKVLSTGGGIIPEWETARPSWFPEELDWLVGCFYEGHTKEPKAVRNVIGANMSFRRIVFEKAGYFSTKIGAIGKKRLAGDDSELCMRVRSTFGAGRIIYVPDALVKHRVPAGRATLEYAFRRSYVEGASKAVIAKMYPKDRTTESLDTETTYLHFLASRGLPSKLNPFGSKFSPSQFVALSCCTTLVLLGYARGRFLPVKGVL